MSRGTISGMPDRATPAPSPGEWVPVDQTLTEWVLVCSVCDGRSDVYQAPLGYKENKRVRAQFLEAHVACAHAKARQPAPPEEE